MVVYIFTLVGKFFNCLKSFLWIFDSTEIITMTNKTELQQEMTLSFQETNHLLIEYASKLLCRRKSHAIFVKYILKMCSEHKRHELRISCVIVHIWFESEFWTKIKLLPSHCRNLWPDAWKIIIYIWSNSNQLKKGQNRWEKCKHI